MYFTTELTKEMTKSVKSCQPDYHPIDTEPACKAGGKPSTWFPPERLVEQNDEKKSTVKKENQNEKIKRLHNRRKRTAHDRARVVWRALCLHREPVIPALSNSSSIEIEKTQETDTL